MNALRTCGWRTVDHPVAEPRGDGHDGGARILMVRRKQPIHGAATHRLAQTVQVRDGVGRWSVIDTKADHHPVSQLRRRKLMDELARGGADVCLSATFGKGEADGECDAVSNHQAGQQIGNSFCA
jgi:hypothetical protein